MTFRSERSILRLETLLRGGFRVAPKALSPLFLRSSRRIGIGNKDNSVFGKAFPIPNHFSTKLQPAQPRIEFGGDFRTRRGIHSTTWQAKSPVHAINRQICRLDGIRHIRRHKEWRRRNPRRPASPSLCPAKISFEPSYQTAVLQFFNLIHDQQAMVFTLFKKIEKSLKQEYLIFPQKLFRLDCRWSGSAFRYYRGEKRCPVSLEQSKHPPGHFPSRPARMP